MSFLYAGLSLAALLASCFMLTRLSKPAGRVEFLLTFWLYASIQLIVLGNLLSLAGVLSQLWAWTLVCLLVLVGILATLWRVPGLRQLAWCKVSLPGFSSLGRWWFGLPRTSRFLLGPLALTAAALGLANLSIVLFVAPGEWDSMCYHLPRLAYYLQQGSLRPFDANYWAQVVHPKNATLLLLYTYLVSQRNENLLQLVQLSSYWVAIATVYGISRRLGYSREGSLFAALVSSLLIEALMQAVTTQNDLLLATYIGIAIYALLSFRAVRQTRYLVWVGMSVGLALGVKASALFALPSIAIVAFYALFVGRTRKRALSRDLPDLFFAGVLGVMVLALPAGYWENTVRYGHPLGPESVRKYQGFEGEPVSYILQSGSKNLLRYGFNFLSLDGLPAGVPIVQDLQAGLREGPIRLVEALGIDLANDEDTTNPFWWRNKPPMSHELTSYWGVLGFGLVWPIMLLALIRIARCPAGAVLAIGSLVLLLLQSYSDRYGHASGRYLLLMMAAFAVPLVGVSLDRKPSRILSLYLAIMVAAGCLSAVTAVLWRQNGPLIGQPGAIWPQESVFYMNRLQQLTRSRPEYYPPLQRYEELVPLRAVVAVCLADNGYEYPLFGNGLTRTLIPVNSFDRGKQPLPAGAEYLLFAANCSAPILSDTSLGEGLYLRALK